MELWTTTIWGEMLRLLMPAILKCKTLQVSFFIFVFDESCLNKNKDMQCKRQQSKKRLKNALLFSDNYQSTIHKYIRQEDSGERFVARKKNGREERRPKCLE